MLSLLRSSEALRLVVQQLPSLLAFAVGAGVVAALYWRAAPERRLALARWGFYALLVVVVSASVTGTFVRRWSFRGDSPQFGLVPMIDGTAGRPFVYRRLATELIAGGADLLGAVTTDAFRQELVRSSPLRGFLQTGESRDQVSLEDWNERKALLYHAAYFFVFGCTAATALAGRALLRRIMPAHDLTADFAPLIGLMLLPITFIRGGYYYDASELLLLTLFTFFLAQPNAIALLTTFVLAVLNKESNVLLVCIAGAALWGRVPARRLAVLLGGQLALGGVVLATYWWMYRSNYGAPVWFMLAPNLVFWTDFRSYLMTTDIYAPLVPLPRAQHVAFLLLMAAIGHAGWRVTPAWVRRALVGGLLILVPLLLTSSWRDEVRNLSLVFPLLLVLGTAGVHAIYPKGSRVHQSS